jgi:hypothetical protein
LLATHDGNTLQVTDQLTKTGGKHMSKARDTQKTEKKKAEKTLKERRKDKKEKKFKSDKQNCS